MSEQERLRRIAVYQELIRKIEDDIQTMETYYLGDWRQDKLITQTLEFKNKLDDAKKALAFLMDCVSRLNRMTFDHTSRVLETY